MEARTPNEIAMWGKLFAMLPYDIRQKIHLMELTHVAQQRLHTPQRICGHNSRAQCLAHWERQYSRITHPTCWVATSYWNGLKLSKTSDTNKLDVHSLSNRCIDLFRLHGQ